VLLLILSLRVFYIHNTHHYIQVLKYLMTKKRFSPPAPALQEVAIGTINVSEVIRSNKPEPIGYLRPAWWHYCREFRAFIQICGCSKMALTGYHKNIKMCSQLSERQKSAGMQEILCTNCGHFSQKECLMILSHWRFRTQYKEII
jgi:hypothetical protein